MSLFGLNELYDCQRLRSFSRLINLISRFRSLMEISINRCHPSSTAVLCTVWLSQVVHPKLEHSRHCKCINNMPHCLSNSQRPSTGCLLLFFIFWYLNTTTLDIDKAKISTPIDTTWARLTLWLLSVGKPGDWSGCGYYQHLVKAKLSTKLGLCNYAAGYEIGISLSLLFTH